MVMIHLRKSFISMLSLRFQVLIVCSAFIQAHSSFLQIAAPRSTRQPLLRLSSSHSYRRRVWGAHDVTSFSRSPLTCDAGHVYGRNQRPFSSKTSLRSAVATKSETAKSTKTKADTAGKVPITLLSGFLGSGKTSCLTDLLQNKAGVKVGVIVNDVASVNIDAKLISNLQDVDKKDEFLQQQEEAGQAMLAAGQTVELQNGCACCTLSDELLTSVQSLLDGNRGKDEFDSIVVELSGVADPVSVKKNWADAVSTGHPSTKEASIHHVVTLVDASTFGSDWFSWNNTGDRPDWVVEADDCAAQRKVAELLAEQVEAADVCLLNKIDLAKDEQVDVARSVVKGLNKEAKLFPCTYGKGVAVEDLLGFESVTVDTKNAELTHEHSSHEHSHSLESEASCSDPACTDSSHDHSHKSHSHSHSHSHDNEACSDPTCTDPSHDHSHSHSHSNSHSHSHSHSDDTACADPTCTDPTHDHSHSHEHASTSTDDLGISSFVYKSTTPFHAMRLLSLLNRWPVPIKEELDLGQLTSANAEDHRVGGALSEKSPFVGVLRSKGFCWLAPTAWTGGGVVLEDDAWRHDTAMYWSHAGKHFGVTAAGKFWGSVSEKQMKDYFATNMGEYERIRKEDFVTDEWGDRRQEVVFIGAVLDQEGITKALDECLLTDEEMQMYRDQLKRYQDSTSAIEAAEDTALLLDWYISY